MRRGIDQQVGKMKDTGDFDKCGFCRVLGMEARWKWVKKMGSDNSYLV